jgi:hypothetical protein
MPAMNAPIGRRAPPEESAPRAGGSAAFDAAGAALCAAIVASLSAAHLDNVVDAAHDAGAARVLGLDAQPWRAADVLVGNALAWLPVGTRAARASLASAAASGAAAALLYAVGRRLLAASAPTRRLGSAVAAIVALTASLSAPWQVEAGAVGGSGIGVLLVFFCLWAALAARDPVDGTGEGDPNRWSTVAVGLGLAVGYEPLVGVCAAGACAALVAAEPSARAGLRAAARGSEAQLAACFAAGLLPFVAALVHARPGGSLARALVESWSGERGAGGGVAPLAFARAQIGPVLGAASAAGVALAVLVPPARPIAAALGVLVVLGASSAGLGSPLGPSRFGAPPLIALASACLLAGVALQALVRAVAAARVPFARASAAMVVLLEAVIPVEAADDAIATGGPAHARAVRAVEAWDGAVWGALPPRSILLVADPRVALRARAAKAQGSLRADVAWVDLEARPAFLSRAFASDPALLPLWRDLALAGAPGESSLSSLATTRPVFTAYDPRWGAPTGRHLVPWRLFDRFEPEPHGSSDRRRALDEFAGVLDVLAARIGDDPDLLDVTARLLRARAAVLSAVGDRALADRAAQDLAAFLR